MCAGTGSGPRWTWRFVLAGLLFLAGAYGLFEWERLSGAGLAEARTVAVNAVVFIEIFSS